MWEPGHDGFSRIALPALWPGHLSGGDALSIVLVLAVCHSCRRQLGEPGEPEAPRGVIEPHIILTVPALFRTTFDHNAALVGSACMRCGAPWFETFSKRCSAEGWTSSSTSGTCLPTRCQAHGSRNVSGFPGGDHPAMRRHVRHVVTCGISLWEGIPYNTILTESSTHRRRLLVRSHLAVDDAATSAMRGPS